MTIGFLDIMAPRDWRSPPSKKSCVDAPYVAKLLAGVVLVPVANTASSRRLKQVVGKVRGDVLSVAFAY